jgi:hypothetical protein
MCAPGHDCTKSLGAGLRIHSANTSVRLEILDDDKQGHVTTLGAVDIPNVAACTLAQACVHTFPEQTSPDPAHGTDSSRERSEVMLSYAVREEVGAATDCIHESSVECCSDRTSPKRTPMPVMPRPLPVCS